MRPCTAWRTSSSRTDTNCPRALPPPPPQPHPRPRPTASYEKCYSNDCRHEILENRSSHGTVNGYETDSGPYVGGGGGGRQPLAKGYSTDNECRDRNQQRREADTGNQGDTHSLGDSLTTDSGFYEGPRGLCSQPRGPRDVSYWRRRGQDFSVLLDYADFREPRGGGGGGGGYGRTGGLQPRGQDASAAEEHQRERQRWAAQAQAQAQAQARTRQREVALQQWRMAAERKCQSLGTDEWRPAVTFARQLSDSEGERWAQEQQRQHARTPEGAVLPRTKGKSQSLPRMLQPDSLQYVDMTASGQELYRRVNGHPSQEPYGRHHSDGGGRERWPENDRPASQASNVPKARFSRPLRPPSYEVHQQTRGSSEMLAGDSAPPARDNTPIPHTRARDPRLDYFAQEPVGPGMEPPGYNPPPSYRRPPVMGGGHRGYGEASVNYRYRGEMYQQVYRAPDGGHWFSRHPGGSWPEHQRERSVPSRKQVYPGYGPQERPSGGVQYIPFDDPRVRHISGGLGGNSLTDADKIRHIRNELPSVTVSEHSSDDSAFLPPPLGPIASPDTSKRSPSDYDNDNRWLADLHKETDNFPAATDQNCNRYPKNQGHPATLQVTPSRQSSSSDQGFSETITQVKTIVPDSGVENNKNTKRKISETIFCLVSVPIQANKDSADQNNNETMPSLSLSATETTVSHLESQSLRSKSLTDMPLKSHIHISSSSSMRSSKKAPLRKEIVDAWSLQASADKELCYAGSWPGDQYRNQETQTSSPVAVKGPPQSPPGQEPGQPSSDATVDTSVGTDCGASYGYPMKGRKNLNPSSKSAFSRLSISPAQPPPLLPSGPAEEQRDQPSSSKKSVVIPQEANEPPVAFGQFLLKPASRRPWDAIEELECFNKELQDPITKQPSVDQCIEDLDEAYRNILVLSDPGDQPETTQHVDPERPGVENWGPAIDPDYREVRSAFSRPQGRTTTRPPRDDVPTLSELSLTDYGPLPPQGDPRAYRQDIPVAQESLLRDVGLTVYTETPPGLPGEPCAVSHTALDHPELCQNIQLSWESRISLAKGIPEHINEHSKEKFDRPKVVEERHVNVDNVPSLRGEPNLKIRRARSESSRSPRSEGSPFVNRSTREVFMFEDYDISPDPLSWRDESTIADKHLETLLINEKANAVPAEDLSNLYEVKCAEGIPENESIEQRAARILGIAVPVGALGVADKPRKDGQERQDAAVESEVLIRETQNRSPDRETQHVRRQYEQVTEVPVVTLRQRKKTSEEKEPGPSKDHSQCKEEVDGESHPTVLELPECPPSRLRLSLPVTPDEELALSVFGERKGCNASKLIEALQDKLASFPTSPGLAATERTPRTKEVDSVSSTRSLSIKSSNSEGVAELEQEKCVDLEEGGTQPEEKKETEVEEEEDVEIDVTDEATAKQNERKETEEAEETVMDEDQKEPEVEGEREEEKEKREGQEVVTEPTEEEKSEEEETEPDVEERREKEEKVPEVAVKREEEEEEKRRTDSAEEKEDSSKQVSRPQKPPLLPKPRSGTVAKREITLPLSFSVSCGSATLEDEELLSVSDSYDPSRVERV